MTKNCHQHASKLCSEHIGNIMQVYIDYMVVRSDHKGDHLADLEKVFSTLCQHGLKLNASKCADKCHPFFKLLKKQKEFWWTKECEQAFRGLKAYISNPPILTKPEEGDVLNLYLAVSDHTVSAVLVRDKTGAQSPVY